MNPADQFSALGSHLEAHRALWEPQPFLLETLPWEKTHGELARWLRGCSVDEIDRLEENPGAAMGAPPIWHQWLERGQELSRVPRITGTLSHPNPHWLAWGVKGRKWKQVDHFAAAVSNAIPPSPPDNAGALGGPHFVEWCAGRGGLARTLAAVTQGRATLLEWDPSHAGPARKNAERLRIPLEFVAVDVHQPAARRHLSRERVALALHACGSLTDALLQAAVDRGAAALHCAPCCYSRLSPGQSRYLPLSLAAHSADLRLGTSSLKFATADEQVAGTRVRSARRTKYAWRLALDRLAREATGEDVYRRQGTISPALLRGSFADFLPAIAKRWGWPMPAHWNADTLESWAHERSRRARALGLVRTLFRRPIEVWINLDRILFLHEAGWSARLVEFCPPEASPRNLLLQACEAPSKSFSKAGFIFCQASGPKQNRFEEP